MGICINFKAVAHYLNNKNPINLMILFFLTSRKTNVLHAFPLIDSSFGIQVFRHLNYEMFFLNMSMAPQ